MTQDIEVLVDGLRWLSVRMGELNMDMGLGFDCPDPVDAADALERRQVLVAALRAPTNAMMDAGFASARSFGLSDEVIIELYHAMTDIPLAALDAPPEGEG